MIHIRGRVFPVHIHIIAVHGLGTEHAHLIAAAACERTVRYIQVIVIRRLVIEDVRSLDGFVSASEQAFSVVGIHIVFLVRLWMNHLSGRRIQLQQENAAAPGTIDHPHAVVGIIKYRRVDRIWIFLKVITVVSHIIL